MDKIQLNQYIKSIADQIPVVNSFYTDDVYEVWNGGEIRFGSLCFCITSSSISDNTTTWSGLLYYGDRLLEDKSNRDAVQSDSINVINAIMNAISMDEDIVSINYPTQVELFEQQFADYLAGGYATIQIETENSISKCGYGYIKEVSGCEGAIKELENTISQMNDIINEKDEVIADKDEEIESLTERLENNINPDFTSIGYDMDGEDDLFNSYKSEIDKSKELLDWWNSIEEPTKGDFNTFVSQLNNFAYPPCISDTIVVADGMLAFSGDKIKYLPAYKVKFEGNYYALGVNIRTPSLESMNIRFEGQPLTINSMFQYCKRLKSIRGCSTLDTSKCTLGNSLFQYCELLESVDEIGSWDTSNLTNTQNMFNECKSLISIPHIDTSSVTTMYNMFAECKSLISVPLLNTENVTNMNYMFQNCEMLTTIPQFDTSKVKTASSMLSGCTKLKSLPLLDFSNVTTIDGFLGYSNITPLTDLGGFTGLKINWTSYGSLKYAPNLTVQSLLNVFNTIADVNGLGARTLEIGTTNLNKLTDEQKKIATDKGWTLK